MQIIDNFLETFAYLRDYADKATFEDVVNEADGVTYPLICPNIPPPVAEEIYRKLSEIKGAPIERPVLFMRMSPAGVPCPHQAHSDASMGTHSLMLYLNHAEDCQGGTSFLAHRLTGIAYNPELPEAVAVIQADQNRPDAWSVVDMAHMQPNRAVIFNAAQIHRAEPVGGFGLGQRNARLVLTCFFS